MPLYIDPTAKVSYVFKSDRELPESEQPRFLLRVPTVAAQIEIQEALGQAGAAAMAAQSGENVSGDGISAMTRASFLILRRCWFGVENWKKSSGEPIEFDANEDGGPSDAMLVSLSQGDRIELMNKCIELMGLTEEDRD